MRDTTDEFTALYIQYPAGAEMVTVSANSFVRGSFYAVQPSGIHPVAMDRR